MLEQKKCNPLLALIGAAALFVSLPAMAQNAPAPTPASSPAAATAAPAEAAPATESADAPKGKKQPTPIDMFLAAKPVVQAVMILLLVAAGASWTIFIVKSFNFGSLNKQTNAFLEAFRGARTISDIRRIATAEEFEGNPFADMASVASHEVEMSRQAGLSISGEHRDSTIDRAHAVINAVQATLAKRLSGGSDILASVGSTGPFVGLFGTVYGIMDSFIGIAATNTTSLAVVAPGIAEALLATALGLFAAIPSVIFYNLVQGSISAYGGRSEGFVTELGNTISRLLDKGA